MEMTAAEAEFETELERRTEDMSFEEREAYRAYGQSKGLVLDTDEALDDYIIEEVSEEMTRELEEYNP